MRQSLLCIMVVLLLVTFLPVRAENGKISGEVFGDYYYISQSNNADLEGRNGFWLRRIYFTYEMKLTEKISGRVRFEASHPDGLRSSAGKAVPFIKNAYLKWKMGNHTLYIGLVETPTWNQIEKIWGYRSVEKTPLDLQKMGSSRDVGLALAGKLDNNGKVNYYLTFGNGKGKESDNDKGKQVTLALGFYPAKNLYLEFYGDWNDKPENTDWFTLQGFAAYKSEKGRLGIQFTHQTRKGNTDLNLELLSIFGAVNLSKKTALFARVDKMFDPNPKAGDISYIPFSPEAKSTLIIGGLDFKVNPKVSILPNVEVVLYDDANGNKPKSDVIPRVTFFFKF